MDTIIKIESQNDFDNLPNSFEKITYIQIVDADISINRYINNANISAHGYSNIEISVGRIYAYDISNVYATENATVFAYNNTKILAVDKCQVHTYDKSYAKTYNHVWVLAWHESSVDAYDDTHVDLHHNAILKSNNRVSAIGYNNSKIIAKGTSNILVREACNVIAYERSIIIASGMNTKVSAYDYSLVRVLSDTVSVNLYMRSICILFCSRTVIKKSAKTATVIKSKDIIYKDTKSWLDAHGIEDTELVILYKRVSKDFLTQEGECNQTYWGIGHTLEIEKWNPDFKECGEGKFHACASPYFCDEFSFFDGDKYIAIEINVKDLHVWKTPLYPHKIAFRKGTVLYECDVFGNKMSGAQK